MLRFFVRSRSGNLVLAVLGGLYAASALAILIWFVIDAWQSASLMDRVMQLALLGSGAWGLWLVFNALQNLRDRYPRTR